MSKNFSILALGSLLLLGCGNNSQESIETTEITEPTEEVFSVEIEDPIGIKDTSTLNADESIVKMDYRELHPNGAVKIEGNFDENDERQGVWVSYYENGIKWSESNYSHGVKEGHSITFYPNGKVRYVGEYSNDKQTGKWIFYDEEGKVTKEEEY